MNDTRMSFDAWWEAVQKEAARRRCSWAISEDPEDHREGYEDDLCPAAEVEEQIYSANQP